MEDTDTSYFNVVPASQFNPPSWISNQGNLRGVQFNNDRTKVLLMQHGSGSTTPTLQKTIRIYENSNPNGIIESALDLTYIAQTSEFNFEVGGVRQQLGTGFLYNEDLGKVWVLGNSSDIIAEWDFDIDTNTQSFVQYVTLPYSFESFYFSSEGTELYTSRNAPTGVTIVRYDLSTPFDISTYSVSQTRSWSSQNGLTFTSPPFFYSNGGYGIYLSYYKGGANINKRQFSTPFDFTSIEFGTGYRQAIRRTAYENDIRLYAQLPIFFSEDLRKMNYFNNNNTSAGGRIGIGYFDIPANFIGLGDELGGVRLLPSTVIPF
jgi:hypothetical protein